MLLRPLRGEDVTAVLGHGDVRMASASDRAEERQRLERMVASPSTLLEDGFWSLVVEHEGLVVGDIQARAPRYGFPPGVCEIGITLVPEVRSRGLGTEAVGLFTRYLHDQGWPRVQASTAVSNGAMQTTLLRAGYVVEGTLRAFAPGDIGREDYLMYASVRPT